MAGRLKFPYICLSIILLVLPLVCSEDEENNGKNDMDELLQNLLKADKEMRQSDDTNAKDTGGTEQEHTNDNGNEPKIKTQELSNGVVKSDVSLNNELKQEIIQDCRNKYELILDKDFDTSVGSCYLHKMNDEVYKKDCEGIDNVGKIKIDYQIGNIIENRTLLSSIKGIDGCTERNVSELIEVSVERRDLDESEKRLAERRGCNYCVLYEASCNKVCVQTSHPSGWWWRRKCVRHVFECRYSCSQYNCR